MAYDLPQARVFQDFELAIDPVERAMLPVIVGQVRDLVRYDEEDEKELGLLGAYNRDEVTEIAWPTLGANSTVDETTVRVYGEDVMVAIQKAQFIDDKLAVSPLHSTFDVTDYFTALVAGQENLVIFKDEDNGGLNFSGSLLHRAPVVGDYIRVRQTSQDTIGQLMDWDSQITGLVYTLATRVGTEGIYTPEEDSGNALDEALGASSIATTNTSFAVDGDSAVVYKVAPYTKLAAANASYQTYLEKATSKACEYGLFDVSSTGMDFSVRILDVADTTATIAISSLYFNEIETGVALADFVSGGAGDTDRVWYQNEATPDTFALVGGTPGSDPLGGIVVDDMFILYADPILPTSWLTTGGTYAVGDYVTDPGSATKTYRCIEAHGPTSSNVFADDLAADKWVEVEDVTKFWITGTAYVAGELVTTGSTSATVYRCLTSHTAAALFATDLSAGRWELVKVIAKNDSFDLTGSLKDVQQDYNGTDTAVPEIKSGSEFDSDTDTTYTIEVVAGGAKDITKGDATFNPSIRLRVSSSNFLDPVTVIAPTIANDGSIEVDVGTKGVTVVFNATTDADTSADVIALALGDMWTIECVGRAEDELVGVITADNFPYYKTTVATQSLDFEILQKIDSVNIPMVQGDSIENWEITDTGIQTNTGAQIALTIGLTTPEVYISSATLYAEYEAINLTWSNTLQTVSESMSAADLYDVIGINHYRNPVGYAVRKAMLNSLGVPVIVAPVEDIEDDMDALKVLLSNSNNAYQLVPLSFDESVQNELVAHALSMSTETMDRWRVVYLCTQVTDQYPVIDEDANGAGVTATFGEGPEGLYNLVTLDSGDGVNVDVAFNDVDTFVRAGHTLRYAFTTDMYGAPVYSSFVVTSVLSATELLVLGDYGSASASTRIEIHKDTTAADIIAKTGGRSEGLYTRRAVNVFPPYIEDDNGDVVPGYFLAAAIAGKSAGVDPHQGLTNATLLGFSDVNNIAPASRVDFVNMNSLAEKGVLIVKGDNSNISIRHELTTCMLNRKNREVMITRNVDSLSYQYFDAVAPFIGIANVTPEFVEKLKVELKSITNYIIAVSKRPLIGSQMISSELVSVEADPVLEDKINIHMVPVLPYPFNYADIHIQI